MIVIYHKIYYQWIEGGHFLQELSKYIGDHKEAVEVSALQSSHDIYDTQKGQF